MFEYILRLLILLPIVGAMAWGSLWLWKKAQMGLPMTGSKQGRAIEMVGVLPLGPGSKLAVVEFGGKQILLAISRNGITRLADDGADPVTAPYREQIYGDQGHGDFHVG